MIRSMTGFGTGEVVVDDGLVVRVEIRTVNHRHLNANVRLPFGWDVLEAGIVAVVRKRLRRGHVSVSVSAERGEAGATLASLDVERARQYADALNNLKTELGLDGAVDVATIARLPDVFRKDGRDLPVPELEDLLPALEEGLDRVEDLREKEGERLTDDLRRALSRIGEELQVAEGLAPERLIRERDRLRARVQKLTESVDVDEDRLAREIAYLAEKWDINEELVRFRSHIELFEETLSTGNDGKAGKRLGFIVQEMNREANTIGSKANDPGIAAASVAMKEELERLREQLENVE